MKITTKVLCRRTQGRLAQAMHLDMSGLGIGTVEGLEHCPSVQSLNLSNNCLEEFENFECCKQLWRINLSNNKISCLVGFSKIYALGSLDLSNNLLNWKELSHLRSIFILDLHLHGNQGLENDTYYRLHVIDCLPNVWMLDGRLVTSAERLQVQQFFHDSALSNRPVRHKLTDHPFAKRKSSNKSKTIHGERAYRFAASFPCNEAQNSETDRRRIEYLAQNIQTDLKIKCSYTKGGLNQNSVGKDWLLSLIVNRYKEKEKCNMLLLLLIASVEFKVPTELLKETVAVAKLNLMFGVDTTLLFDLDSNWRVEAICLLVSACKLDRDLKRPDSNFSSGGLYDRLYLCLYHAVAHLVALVSRCERRLNADVAGMPSNRNVLKSRPHSAPSRQRCSGGLLHSQSRLKSDWKVHQRLLGSELALLLSVVPTFYNYIAAKDPSVCKLLFVATGDPRLASRLAQLTEELSLGRGDINTLYREICRSVRKRIQYAAQNTSEKHIVTELTDDLDSEPVHLDVGRLSANTKQARFILNTAYAYPKRPKSGVLVSGEHLTSGKIRTCTSPIEKEGRKLGDPPPLTLGSQILLGAQNLARVIALPEAHVALVQMDSVPASNGSIVVQARDIEQHYSYVDVKLLEFEPNTGVWRPKGSVGDRVTLQPPKSLVEVTVAEADQLDAESQKKLPSVESDVVESIALQPFSSRKQISTTPTVRKPSTVASKTTRNSKHVRSSTAPADSQSSWRVSKSNADLDSSGFHPPLRPLSSMFCEKMELSLSEAVLQTGLMVRYPTDRATQETKPTGQPTFLTDLHETVEDPINGRQEADDRYQGERMTAQEVLDMALDGAWPGEVPYGTEAPPGSVDPDGSAEEENASPLESERFDHMLDLPRHDGSPANSDGSQRELEAVLPHGGAMSPDDVARRPSAPTITIPSPVLGDPAKSVVSADVVATDFQEGSEDWELQQPEVDLSLVSYHEDKSSEINKKEQEKGQLAGADHHGSRSKKKADSRRVQSAKVPRTPVPKKSAIASRPYSAVVTRSKHVMFSGQESDIDSRPGSASSFQLRRTEAWRSSASSGSVGFGETVAPKSFPFAGFVTSAPAVGAHSNQNGINPTKVKFSTGLRKPPPPQRPTSPEHQGDQQVLSVTPLKQVERLAVEGERGPGPAGQSEPGKAPTVSKSPDPNRGLLASNWLAQGRDVHHEKQAYRRLITSPRLPGYLEGTSMMPAKPRKSSPEKRSVSPTSDVALHLLPSRPTSKALMSRLPQATVRRSFEGPALPQSALGGSLVWSRPRFSTLKEIKQLSKKPQRKWVPQSRSLNK